MSYHLKDIPRGEYGEFSKIKEELLELEDALDQDAKIMALAELSDLVGAIEGYVEKHFDGLYLSDLIIMSKITRRAFESGRRK